MWPPCSSPPFSPSALLAVSEARSAQTAAAQLQVDGAKQQASMEAVIPRLDRMESKLDQALDGRIGR